MVAWDEAEGQVVGFITAISDGVLTAYIPLLEVLPTYQNQGIGHMLVRRMLARLSDIYMIDVVCDPGLQSFYEKVGMTPLLAMSMRNYSQQAGIAGP